MSGIPTSAPTTVVVRARPIPDTIFPNLCTSGSTVPSAYTLLKKFYITLIFI